MISFVEVRYEVATDERPSWHHVLVAYVGDVRSESVFGFAAASAVLC
jgi:hypothetical protein